MIRKILAIVFSVLILLPDASAADIFVAQASAGGNTGANCANARALSSLVAGDWTAGNFIDLCGTITSTFSAQGNGSSGNPITIRFQTGANITVANCGTNGCIGLNGASWIVVDGSPTATPCGYVGGVDVACNGTIACTNVGTGLGNADCNGIYMRGGTSHIEIRNLNGINGYVHTCPNPTTCNDANATGNYYFVWSDGSNNSIHNNVCHDWYGCVKLEAGANNTNINNNQFYNSNWGEFASGTGNANGLPSISVITIHDNHIHDFCNWDETGNKDHHDGIALAGNNNAANGVFSFTIYNNNMGGCLTQTSVNNMTALIFFNDGHDIASGDNILAPSIGFVFNGLIFYWSPGTLNSNSTIDNNTVICATNASNTGSGISIEGDASVTMSNNAITGCNIGLSVYSSPTTTFTSSVDNGYQNSTLNAQWRVCNALCSSPTTYNSLALFRTGTTNNPAETTSVAQTGTFNLNGSYRQNSGSALIGAGTNLTNTPSFLNSDIGGNARPAPATAWDIGAWFGAASAGAYTIVPNQFGQ